ncbi:MAG: N-acetylglucosamine kinase [Ferruginibacter sp.]
MTIQLIADSGSTTTDWALVYATEVRCFKTEGISPYFHSDQQIQAILHDQVKPQCMDVLPEQIHFYGTGCASASNATKIKSSLSVLFPASNITVEHDLLGAARALCGRSPAIACILGTGSNSCEYDGNHITQNRPGLGYVLGDEGSGAYLGKQLVARYLYGDLDTTLAERFAHSYGLNKDMILDRVYRQPLANRFLAGFAPFLSENRGDEQVEQILRDSFGAFVNGHIARYQHNQSLPVHATGSIAAAFSDVLIHALKEAGMQAGQVMKTPVDGLVRYHTHA